MKKKLQIGIVGARGHVGGELLAMLTQHPSMQVVLAVSRLHAGQLLSQVFPGLGTELQFEDLDAEAIAKQALDGLVLALPNGLAASYVAAVATQSPQTVIIDLSADYRFDNLWYYGLPELTRQRYQGEKRISNPGCYATAMQLAIAPVLDLLSGPVQCFGVSGYSGAGTSPSDKNNPEKLHENLLPYSLTGHIHEREVAHHLDYPVEFMPHVAAYFRGITMTVNMHFSEPQELLPIWEKYQRRYENEKLLRLSENAPWVNRLAGQHHAEIGGLTLADNGRRAVVVCALDNLLKGAATQAMQNLNLALGQPEFDGILL